MSACEDNVCYCTWWVSTRVQICTKSVDALTRKFNFHEQKKKKRLTCRWCQVPDSGWSCWRKWREGLECPPTSHTETWPLTWCHPQSSEGFLQQTRETDMFFKKKQTNGGRFHRRPDSGRTGVGVLTGKQFLVELTEKYFFINKTFIISHCIRLQ